MIFIAYNSLRIADNLSTDGTVEIFVAGRDNTPSGSLTKSGATCTVAHLIRLFGLSNEINHPSIRLKGHEIESGLNRVKHAEGLIEQLPEDHDGRNTWLLNYGTGSEAINKRENNLRGANADLWDTVTESLAPEPCEAPEAAISGKTGRPLAQEAENSGDDVNYYLCPVPHPKRLDPYTAECEDIIEALDMTFAEGSAFKSIWRSCAERTLGLKKAGNTSIRDAEKVIYYGRRMKATREKTQ